MVKITIEQAEMVELKQAKGDLLITTYDTPDIYYVPVCELQLDAEVVKKILKYCRKNPREEWK